jgi:hypothetical protein
MTERKTEKDKKDIENRKRQKERLKEIQKEGWKERQ